MAIQAFSQALGSVIYFIQRPYEEAKRQRQYALFREATAPKDIISPSLTGRVTHLAISLLLLFPGVNIIIHAAMRHFDFDSGRQFYQAIEEGDLKQLDFFLQIGWNPNQQFRGKPLIFIAYEHNQLEALKRLLEEPSCNSNTHYDGKTVFHLAAQKEDTETVRLLMDLGASANVKQTYDQYTPALLAYLKGNSNLALEIIDKTYLINGFVDRRKKTLLNYAWKKNDIQMIEKLIRRGAKPPSESTISHYSVMATMYEREKELIISQMIPAGWDVNSPDPDGHTLLELVVGRNDWKFARLLVQNGAHIDVRKPDGTRVISFDQFQYDAAYYRDFLEDPALLLQGKSKCNPFNWLRGEPYLYYAVPSLVARSKRDDFNPLEKVYFMGSEVAMQRLACSLTYSEFVDHLVTLRIKYKKRIQTDWIINALYQVNPRHFIDFEDKTIDRETIQAPEKHVFLHTLLSEFNKISELTEADRTFEGFTYSREEVEKGLRDLISAITHRQKKAGLPKDQVERDNLHKNMENILRQIAYYLHQDNLEPAKKKEALLELAYAGHCARDWPIVLYQVFCILADREYQILTFADLVMIDLGQFRLELLKNQIYRNKRGDYKYALNKIKESRAIPAEPFDPEDLPPDITHTQLEEENIFDRYYTPINIVKATLEKRRKDQYFREYFIDYFRDIESKKWIEAPFGQITKEINKMPAPKNLTPAEVQRFFAKHGENVQQTLNGRDITIQAVLDDLRFHACYQTVESVNSKETYPLGTARMLESLGYLLPRDPNIFGKSFRRSFSERLSLRIS